MKFVDDTKIPDHPYPELREVLSVFTDEIAAELGENLVGIYLVGSLATGDFDADSDVDFLVVTNTELTEAHMNPLQEIQVKIHSMDCYPAKHLEGSYICIADLNDRNTVGEKNLFYFDNGSTAYELSTHDNQWHVRWILRERGITLIGPKPETLLPSIPLHEMQKEIRAAMLHVKQLFEEEINRPLSFFNSRFGQSFTVLTCCRMLHTLRTNTVQSKKAGMTWAKKVVDPKWVEFIEQAWQEREGVRFMQKIRQRAEQQLLYDTLKFLNDVISEIDSSAAQAQVESSPKESA
jgi:hypothetical protein